jgi:hypothetical protein
MKASLILAGLIFSQSSFAFNCTGNIQVTNGMDPAVTSAEVYSFDSSNVIDFSPDNLAESLNKKKQLDANAVALPGTLLAQFVQVQCDFFYDKLLATKLVQNRINWVTISNKVEATRGSLGEARDNAIAAHANATKNFLARAYNAVGQPEKPLAVEPSDQVKEKVTLTEDARKALRTQLDDQEKTRITAKFAVDNEDPSELAQFH